MGNVGCTMYDTAAVVHPPHHDDGDEEGDHPHQEQEHEADDEQVFSLQHTDTGMALLPQIDFAGVSSRSAALRRLNHTFQDDNGHHSTSTLHGDDPLAQLDGSLLSGSRSRSQITSEQRYGASFTGTLSSVADPTLMLGDNSQKAAADVEGDWSEGAHSVSMHAGRHESFLREVAAATTTAASSNYNNTGDTSQL